MNKGFDETPLNNFKDKEDFLSGWRGHAEKLTNSQANCHKLRVELLEKFKRFDIEIDGRATIEIELGCPYSKAEISQREYGIWFSVCKDYHRISAEYIYDGCLSKLPKGANPGAFDCPVCNAKVRSLKEFKLDYITYNYYSIMEVPVSANVGRQEHHVDNGETIGGPSRNPPQRELNQYSIGEQDCDVGG